jgi:hypothetical protein
VRSRVTSLGPASIRSSGAWVTTSTPLEQPAARRGHHRAQDLAGAAGDDRQLDAAIEQRLHADAGDESGTDHQDPGPGLEPRCDRACIGERPARDHAGQSGPVDGRQRWRRSRCHEQPVVVEPRAVVQFDRAVPGSGADPQRPSIDVRDAALGEVARVAALQRAVLGDPPG